MVRRLLSLLLQQRPLLCSSTTVGGSFTAPWQAPLTSAGRASCYTIPTGSVRVISFSLLIVPRSCNSCGHCGCDFCSIVRDKLIDATCLTADTCRERIYKIRCAFLPYIEKSNIHKNNNMTIAEQPNLLCMIQYFGGKRNCC